MSVVAVVALIVVLALVCLALVAGIVVAGLLWVRRRAASTDARVQHDLGDTAVERRTRASFFGKRSAGKGQARGLGELVLTPDDLVFFQMVPDRVLRVGRSSITAVTTARSYLGKTQGCQLLVVAWHGPEGPDEAAWRVPDLVGWQAALAAGA